MPFPSPRRWCRFLAAFAVLPFLALAACTSTAPRPVPLVAPPPVGPPRVPVIESALSEIPLSFTIPWQRLGEMANEAVPPHLAARVAEDWTGALSDDWYSYDVVRQPVVLGFANGRITFEVPVAGTFAAGGRAAGLPVKETVRFRGRIHGSVSPQLGADWSPVLSPELDADFDRAEMKVFGLVKISVKSRLKERLVPRMRQAFVDVVGRMVEDLHLRAQAEAAWRGLHLAHAIAADPPLWVRFEPRQLFFLPPQGDGTALTAGLLIRGNLRVHLSGHPASPAVTPLPPSETVAGLPSRYRLEVPVVLESAELSRAVSRRLAGFHYRFANSLRFEAESVDVSALGDKLVFALAFRATRGTTAPPLSGRIYVAGKPLYDPATRTLALADLDYDLKTRSFLLHAASYWLHSDFLAKLAAAARLELGPILDQATAEARRIARAVGLPAELAGPVALDAVQVQDVVVAQGNVYLATVATGPAAALQASRRPGR